MKLTTAAITRRIILRGMIKSRTSSSLNTTGSYMSSVRNVTTVFNAVHWHGSSSARSLQLGAFHRLIDEPSDRDRHTGYATGTPCAEYSSKADGMTCVPSTGRAANQGNFAQRQSVCVRTVDSATRHFGLRHPEVAWKSPDDSCRSSFDHPFAQMPADARRGKATVRSETIHPRACATALRRVLERLGSDRRHWRPLPRQRTGRRWRIRNE